MSHTLYTALSGAVAEERNLEVISDNLANTTTAGFKGSRLSFRDLLTQQSIDGSTHTQVEVADSHNDMTQGTIKATGNPLDVALRGPGFFSVNTPAGERLTRQGSFVHASDGYLRTQSGHAVMGEGGPLRARNDLPLSIDKGGNVFSDGVYIDSIKRLQIADPEKLVREGNSLWRADSPETMQKAQLVGTPLDIGGLEASNVNAVQAMTQLINTQRHYEMYHKAIENNRQLEQKAASQLG